MIIKIESGWSGDITFSFSIVGAMIQNRLEWLTLFTFLYFSALKHMSMIKIICSLIPRFIFLLLYFHRCLCLQMALMRCYKIIVTCDMCRIFKKLEIISHIFKQKNLQNETTIYACMWWRKSKDYTIFIYFFMKIGNKIKWNPAAIVTLSCKYSQ